MNDLTILYGNKPGTALPETGGSGTGLIRLIGYLLLLTGEVLLRLRRQTSEN